MIEKKNVPSRIYPMPFEVNDENPQDLNRVLDVLKGNRNSEGAVNLRNKLQSRKNNKREASGGYRK